MKTSIGKFDPESRTVAVTFKEGSIVHRRSVNAVLDDKGEYDQKATKLIIDQQEAGVAEKIRLGVIC